MSRHLPTRQPLPTLQIGGLEDLGLAVRNARADARMRIDDAAAFAGVSADLLSRLENGRPVTSDRLLKVLDSLGLEMRVVSKGQLPEPGFSEPQDPA